jgi:hypothetical protein
VAIRGRAGHLLVAAASAVDSDYLVTSCREELARARAHRHSTCRAVRGKRLQPLDALDLRVVEASADGLHCQLPTSRLRSQELLAISIILQSDLSGARAPRGARLLIYRCIYMFHAST